MSTVAALAFCQAKSLVKHLIWSPGTFDAVRIERNIPSPDQPIGLVVLWCFKCCCLIVSLQDRARIRAEALQRSWDFARR